MLKIFAALSLIGTILLVICYHSSYNQMSPLFLVESQNVISDKDRKDFSLFIQKYNKAYLTTDEYNIRLKIFVDNLQIIRKNNPVESGYTLGISQFADLTLEEFDKFISPTGGAVENGTAVKLEQDDKEEISESNNTSNATNDGRKLQAIPYPFNFDWRMMGALNQIKNQGRCGGGSYAFSAIASVESLYRIRTGILPNLSEQQIIDCSIIYGNMGCTGGLLTTSFRYLQDYKVQNSSSYPYQGKQKKCQADFIKGVVNICRFREIPQGNYNSHLAALQISPISTYVAASSSIFQFYTGGIITGGCGSTLNQAVNIIGYGTQMNIPFWIVRNSWGTQWGESGYFRIRRQTVNGNGTCGILKESSQPIMMVP